MASYDDDIRLERNQEKALSIYWNDFSFCMLCFVLASKARSHETLYYSNQKRYACMYLYIILTNERLYAKISKANYISSICDQKYISQLRLSLVSSLQTEIAAIYFFLLVIAYLVIYGAFIQICTPFYNQSLSNAKMNSMFCVAFSIHQLS